MLLADYGIPGLPLFPEQASEHAARVDHLTFFLLAVTGAVGLLVTALLTVFVTRYRRRSDADRTPRITGFPLLEWGWTLAPLGVFAVMFGWGLTTYTDNFHPPPDAYEVFVVGKQWMWKVQHPGGEREINELHLPAGKPVKVTLISEDVIHDFGVPAFRSKIDVLPGRYVSTWYLPTEPGRYHLFCDQFCGTGHATMVGSVVVMPADEHAAWLRGKAEGSAALEGRKLFLKFQCVNCHSADPAARAPVLEGLYGRRVALRGGGSAVAEHAYIRESILFPAKQVVEGWEPIMPTFQGQASEEDVLLLIAYLRSLSRNETPVPNNARPAAGRGTDRAARRGGFPEMSTVAEFAPQAAPQPADDAAPSYLTASHGWRSWLFTTDHKRIALLYLVTVTLFFLVGGAAATVIRLNLITPRGALVTAEMYNKLFTAHGIVMVWFFLIPVVPTVLGNFVLPLMIGARDLAFPRLNLLSWYVFVTGAVITFTAILSGGVDTGWTFYPPFSTRSSYGYVVAAAVGVIVVGFSTIMTGLNFVVTVHTLRAPGMTWGRLPIFVWSTYATSLIMLLATPVLAAALALLVVERAAGIGIFDPALGGDPVLFQHLFWFYSHPAVYIMILPGMGVVTEVITCFSRKNLFGYTFVAAASIAIAVFGFLVWGHHMFVAGQSLYASVVFSALSYVVAVPSAIKVFNWTATMYRGSIAFEAPMVYALGFILLFTFGGLTGLFLAALAVDQHVHDTYFIIAHFHFIMVGGMVSAYFAGLHYWWPKITGRMYSRTASRLAALLILAGFALTFLPQFILGYLGMPRRSHQYPPEFQVLNVLSSAGASVLAVGYLMPFAYLFYSLRWGPAAGPNPWRATGLEWQTPSPPPEHNFDEPPLVTRGPYEYAEGGDGHAR